MLQRKSEALAAFTKFKAMAELQIETKIKALQSNWGGEYRAFSTLLQHHGITHRVICPHTHEQNGLIERKHRHITEMALTLLSTCSLKYWDASFETIVFLINILTHSKIVWHLT